ncbi:MAG: TRAP transporter small permease [Roseibium sp.]
MSLRKTSDFLGMLMRAEEVLLTGMKWSIITGMAGMVIVVFLQIVSRYVFSLPLAWSEEVARLLFICIVFIGAAVLARQEGHLAVTVLIDQLPKRIRRVANAFSALVGLICAYYLVRGGWSTLLREWDQRTPGLQFPMGVIYAVIFASVMLMMLWLFVIMVKNCRLAIAKETS